MKFSRKLILVIIALLFIINVPIYAVEQIQTIDVLGQYNIVFLITITCLLVMLIIYYSPYTPIVYMCTVLFDRYKKLGDASLTKLEKDIESCITKQFKETKEYQYLINNRILKYVKLSGDRIDKNTYEINYNTEVSTITYKVIIVSKNKDNKLKHSMPWLMDSIFIGNIENLNQDDKKSEINNENQ